MILYESIISSYVLNNYFLTWLSKSTFINVLAICEPPCEHGECVLSGHQHVCKCNDGYDGQYCRQGNKFIFKCK